MAKVAFLISECKDSFLTSDTGAVDYLVEKKKMDLYLTRIKILKELKMETKYYCKTTGRKWQWARSFGPT